MFGLVRLGYLRLGGAMLDELGYFSFGSTPNHPLRMGIR